MDVSKYDVGIDISNNSIRIAVFKNGKIEVDSTRPCAIYFGDSEISVGKWALFQLQFLPEDDLLKLLKSDKKTLKDNKENWPFKIDFDKEGKCLAIVKREKIEYRYYIHEVLAHVIKDVTETFKKSQKMLIDEITVTVPDHLNREQRNAVEEAANIASISVKRIISRSTATLIGNNFKMNNFINGNVLIIHIGKTMLETSILNLESNDYTFLGNKFDSSVSGTKIDDYLVKYAVDSLKSKKTQLNIPEYYMKDLRIECERVKKMLDIAPYGNVLVEKYRVKISLLVLNNLCKEMYATIIRTIEEVLSEASLTKNEISKIFLIGNSTKASEIKRIVNEYFESKQVIQEIDPDQMAVKGAAIFSSDPFDINEQLIKKSAVNIVNLSVEEIEKAKHTFEIDFFKSEDFKKATDFKRELWYCLENVMDALNNKSTRINFDLYYFPEAYQDIKKTFRWVDEKMSTLTYKEVSEKRKGIKKVVFSILEKADTFGSYYFPDLDETLL